MLMFLKQQGRNDLPMIQTWQFVRPVSVAACSDGDALLVLLAAFELSGGKRIIGLHMVEKPSFVHVVYVNKCILV
jgi:hypothetical protein